MNIIGNQIRSKYLIQIKKIVDSDKNGDKFVILRTKKNVNFIREYGLTTKDIKNMVRKLSVEDCYSGPEEDRDKQYKGWIFKFCPLFDGVKLYIKIRVENSEKSVCLSVHEFGKYNEVE